MNYLKLKIGPSLDGIEGERFHAEIEIHSPIQKICPVYFSAKSIRGLTDKLSARGISLDGEELKSTIQQGAVYIAENFDFPKEFLSDFED